MPCARDQRLVGGQRSRIGGEILVGAKLSRIDENAHDDAAGGLCAERGEAHMARMQIAHRRREGDCFAGRSPLGNDGANVADGVNDAYGARGHSRFSLRWSPAHSAKQCSGAG